MSITPSVVCAALVTSLLLASTAAADPLVVYVHGGGGRMHSGTTDDAAQNISVAVYTAGLAQVDIPAFEGTAAEWQGVLQCARQQLAGFPVTLVDQRPSSSDFILIMVGGRSFDPYRPAIGGTATMVEGRVVERGTGFLFSAAYYGANRAHDLCLSLAHEIGHSLGLPHSDDCRDIMNIEFLCARTGFQDANRTLLAASLAKWGSEVALPMPARVTGVIGEPSDATGLSPTFHTLTGAPGAEYAYWPVSLDTRKPVARALLHVVTPLGYRSEYHCLPDGERSDGYGCSAKGQHIRGWYPVSGRGTWHMLIEVFYTDGEIRRTQWYSMTKA